MDGAEAAMVAAARSAAVATADLHGAGAGDVGSVLAAVEVATAAAVTR